MSHSARNVVALATAVAAVFACALIAAASASAEFGFDELDTRFENPDGSAALQAGSHPFSFTTTFGVNTHIEPDAAQDPETGEPVDGEVPDGEVKNLIVAQIPGLVGRPAAVPRCSIADFTTRSEGRPACSDASAVGMVAVKAEFNAFPPATDVFVHAPVYNLAPSPGQPARFGFVVLNVPIVVDAAVNPEAPSNIIARIGNVPQSLLFYGSRFTLWGNPADSRHDPLRGNCLGDSVMPTPEPVSLGECEAGVEEAAFLTLPRACEGPLPTIFTADSWALPGTYTAPRSALTHDGSEPPSPLGMQGCSELGFSPTVSARPTSSSAGGSSGLDFGIQVDDPGLTSPTGFADSDIRTLELTLPAGMTANPSSADGLAGCTEAQLEAETVSSQGCPDASKLGTVEVRTPLLEETFGGSVYLAEPYRNPFDSLFALYVVIRNPQLGIIVKQPVEVEADPRTGQLVSTATEIPQLPFSSFEVHLREGPRAPLVTPSSCGSHTAVARLAPWAGGADVEEGASFELSSGSGGTPCPAGSLPFSPALEGGTISNGAGSFSPFYLRFTRRDGDQELTRFSTTLPPGLLAKLAGVEQCPEAAIALARSRTGRNGGHEELAGPSCPAGSQLGRVVAGAGVGEALTYVPGSLYLAGPYDGAPLSVVSVVPGIAGPFDVGTIVTRLALRVDPRSALVTVDGASDPIPHILAGIPLRVRDIRAYVERPQFTLNPTSCDPAQVGALLWGGGTDPLSSADDSAASLASRFQAAGCSGLGFRPNLKLALRGGTRRNAHPAIRGEFRPRPGDANLEKLVLRLPRTAFLDQSHIRTICTRVQFAADACPSGAVYGYARAWTPLLAEPLQGPVYLRANGGERELPDLVADLRGLIDVEAVGYIDSKKGGLRTTFAALPDAPLTKVVISMQGGKKGLIVNSTSLCARKQHAAVTYSAHNGVRVGSRPALRVPGCKPAKPNRKEARR